MIPSLGVDLGAIWIALYPNTLFLADSVVGFLPDLSSGVGVGGRMEHLCDVIHLSCYLSQGAGNG